MNQSISSSPQNAIEPEADKLKMSVVEIIVTILTLLGIWSFLLYYFQPDLLFSDTTTSGGDTGSHNLLAYHLRNFLLPKGKIIGWLPDNFAGLPLFQFYFPLPYFIIAILSYVIPFNIAFKLTTVLGIFFFPIASYLCMRAMKFRFPIPIIAASICLLFLFKESGIAAGGTIKSALAGQFAYNLSVALMILALGFVYKGVEEKGYVIPSAVVIAGIVFSHAFGLIPVMIACSFFVFEDIRHRNLQNTIHLAKIFGLGFFLTGFWSIPYLYKRQLGMIVYDFAGLSSSFAFLRERIFWIPLLISVIGILFSFIFRQHVKHQLYIFYWFAGIVFFSYITQSSLLLSRFTNVMFLFAILAAVSAIASVHKWLQAVWLMPLIAALIIFSFLKHDTKEIGSWIKWNYEGMEKKAGYSQYRDINAFFAEKQFQGRIDFEYYDYNSFGSPRIFELSPMFHGKPVMEGLLFESSITYPFFFYMQHEVSEKCWWPGFPIRMPKQNMANGVQDFRLFNVHYFVAKEAKTKDLADAEPSLIKEKDIGDMRIYRVSPASQYVEVLRHEPILVKTDNWRPFSYTWMGADRRDIILAFTTPGDTLADKYFPVVFNSRTNLALPNKKEGIGAIDDDLMNRILSMGRDYDNRECKITEHVEKDRISFTTTCIGRPHLIKMSYFPNWKVKGASKIYQASPSLMLVIPESETVELYYGYLPEDIIGIAATVLSLIGILLFIILPQSRPISYFQGRLVSSERSIHQAVEYCMAQTVYRARTALLKPEFRKRLLITLIIILITGCGVILIVQNVLRINACKSYCASGHKAAQKEAADVDADKRLLDQQDIVKLGFNDPESKKQHNVICEGALCDESRPNFVYVNSGAVLFDLQGKKGRDHILTVFTQDNVNCRSNVVMANDITLGKMIGKGLQTKERRFQFYIPASVMTDNHIRMKILKDKDDCYGFDIFKVKLDQITCDCES